MSEESNKRTHEETVVAEETKDEANTAQPVVSEASSAAAGEIAAEGPPMSKKAKRRMERMQLQKEHHKEKRKQVKEKKKAERAATAAAATVTSTNGEGDLAVAVVETKHERPVRASKKERSEEDAVGTVVFDLGFCDQMTDKELRSLANQLNYSYGANNAPQKKFHLCMTSFTGNVVPYITKNAGYVHWVWTQWEPKHYTEVFKKEQLVYLTSEAKEPLTTVEKDKVYIIGGIVDHNRLKGITHGQAEKLGLESRRLPIDEYLVMNGRKVLTVNHVFEILLQFANLGDWAKAMEKVLPPRKNPQLRIEPTAEVVDTPKEDKPQEK